MSVQQAASAAVRVFADSLIATPRGSLSLRVVMVAIAGAESNWDPQALGDYGLGGPTCGNSSTSWGLWQIHNVHSAYLARVTGSPNPCTWVQWLMDPLNNAKAAEDIYQSQGLAAWSTYSSGAWAGYIGAAQSAVQAAGSAAASPTTSSASPTTATVSPPAYLPRRVALGVGLAGVLVMAGGLAWLAYDTEDAWEPRERQWARAMRERGILAPKEGDTP